MLILYPPIEPYTVSHLMVDSVHTLYVEESGNPKGIPIVFLHGGPGVGTFPGNRRYFNPDLYRIILFDQRGTGKSTPHAALENNNTQLLVSDMEIIRKSLGIDRWVVFGGSWGTTLALIYAQTYPERVLSMILRGTFLARPKDISWLYQQGGASQLFPDFWDNFISHLSGAERNHILESYYNRLITESDGQLLSTATAWAQWEASIISLKPIPEFSSEFTEPHTALSTARIEAYYFVNKCFLESNQILENAHRLREIPGILVQGRYDVICPLENAYELHKSWKGSELKVIPDAGHASYEPGIISALIEATDKIGKILNV